MPHRDWFYLETNDGTMTSRHWVVAGINLGAFEGQEVTLALRLKELPVALIYPGETRLVRDPSALRASTLPSAPGLRRLKVDVARITAAPGRGLAASRIHGVLYHGRGTTGANGYEFREEVRLLLTDGWAYLREDIAPADIDVELSRRLEPQNWCGGARRAAATNSWTTTTRAGPSATGPNRKGVSCGHGQPTSA